MNGALKQKGFEKYSKYVELPTPNPEWFWCNRIFLVQKLDRKPVNIS